MALQELDLQIKYRPGKANARADPLSRYPVSLLQDDVGETQVQPLVAAVREEPPEAAEDGEKSDTGTLGHRQRRDPQLADVINYWETGKLPQEEKRARELVLTSPMFTMLDGTLYRIEPDKFKKIVPPTSDRHQLFLEVH